ncbi:MAG: HYR-like domain-containing protein, partial [Planctomycetota bacterium]
NDTTDPVLSGVPGPESVQCDDDVPLPATVTCDDNCDGAITPVFDESDDGQTCPRTITRTWTCTDACENSVTETQTITVDDTIPPTVTCPASQELTCGVEFCFTATAEDNCDPDPAIDCAVIAASDPTRVEFVPQAGNGEFCVTLTASATATIECTATDICTNGSDPCAFDVSATCNQACSPGFWRNNLEEWCDFTPFNPFDNFCGAGLSATLFVDAFEFACPGGCTNPEIPASFDPATLTLHDAVDTSGGSFNQALFHGSAALLSSYAVSFPVGPQAVLDEMQDAFAGVITFTEAFNTFATWNAAENEGGCPLDGSPPPSEPPTLESTVEGDGGGE